MHRIHKYKAQRLGFNDWVYGNLVYTDELSPVIYFQVGKGSVKTIDFVYIKPDTICEFSNMYDKNHQEIYEGDIIEFYALKSYCINPDCEPHLLGYGMRMVKVTGIVTFSDGMFGVENDYGITPIYHCGFRENEKEDLKNEISDPYFDYDPNECNINDIDSLIGVKVIGNIYENNKED